MDINPSKFAGFVTGIVSLALMAGAGYLLYTIFFTGAEPQANPNIATMNVSIFGPKIQEAAQLLTGANKVSFNKDKDLGFTRTPLYVSFTDLPEVVPLSDSRGRPDPFVPYAAP